MAESKSAIEQTLIHIVADLTQDWGIELDEPLSAETRLVADMEFASVDIIQLIVAIQEDILGAKLPFEKLLMKDGRYVDDLSIGQIADFIAQQRAG